jgi:hypothetical protein
LHLSDLYFLHHDGFGHNRGRVLLFGETLECHPPGYQDAEDEERGEEEFRT